jgi:hypothetical protein
MRPRLAFAWLLLMTLGVPPTGAQSLGQLAQQEAERRRAITAPARTITTADLVPSASAVSGPAPTSATADDDVVAARVPLAPATWIAGVLPRIPVEAVGGGEVLLELTVDRTGRVIGTAILRDTPPFTAELMAAVRDWRFQPAEDAAAPQGPSPVDRSTSRPIEAQVLVVGLFRPPSLFPITLGQPPVTLATPSEGAPAPLTFPAMPAYPPQALFDGVMLTELRVGVDGVTRDMRVLRAAPGFEVPTRDVLRGLAFRPARLYGIPAEAMVYVVTAFRQPVIQ